MRRSGLGALLLVLSSLTAGAALTACATRETPPVAREAKPGRVEVKKDGEVLGYVHITPGAPGRLERKSSSAAAKELEERWIRDKCSDSVAVESERRTDKGGFELGATIVPATSAEYGESVRWYLMGKGYDARMLEADSAGPAASATPAAPPTGAPTSGQAPTIPELGPLEKELRGGIPAGSGDYAKALALATLFKRGTISFKQLEEAIVALKLPPHKLGDGYLMTPVPVPPPGVTLDPKMMPKDWEGNFGEVAMVYHLGVIDKAQYNELHKAAHPTSCKL